MLENCESCGKDFLTEADPYVVRPTPSGRKLYCYCHIKGFDEIGGKIKELEQKLSDMRIQRDMAEERIIELEAKRIDSESELKKGSKLVMTLQSRVESLIAENAKLFEEAKRELAYKDKKIAYLEAECERVYHPIREFWNQEKDEEHKKTKNELNLTKQIIKAIARPWFEYGDDHYFQTVYETKQVFHEYSDYFNDLMKKDNK